MPNSLQNLRKEAGYRTAKDFAEAVDIPAPTYTRYEQEPAKIPIERAWIIADFLGCTIDAVVGRTPIKPSEMRGPVQRVYDALSDKNKGLLDDYLDYIQYKDGKEQARDRAQDQRRYEELVQQSQPPSSTSPWARAKPISSTWCRSAMPTPCARGSSSSWRRASPTSATARSPTPSTWRRA